MTSSTLPPWSAFWDDLNKDGSAQERRTDWASYWLYRRPGIFTAYFAAQRGISPTQITCAAFVVAVTLPLLAIIFPLWLSVLSVWMVGVLFQVLDCADGTLARATNQYSRRGGDADFLTDMVQWAMLYSAIGILADRWFESGLTWTCIALIAAWGRLLARVIRDRLCDQHDSKGPVDTNLGPMTPAAFVAGISGLLPFLALAGPFLIWSVILLLAYSILDIAEALLPMLKR